MGRRKQSIKSFKKKMRKNKKTVVVGTNYVAFQYIIRVPIDKGAKAFRDLQEYMRRHNIEKDKLVKGGLLALLGCICLPIIAPIFAAPGLFGAAAYSSGLAALGGGSIATGGLGMLGGTALVATTSYAIGTTLPASKQQFTQGNIKDENGTTIFSGLFKKNIPYEGVLYIK